MSTDVTPASEAVEPAATTDTHDATSAAEVTELPGATEVAGPALLTLPGLVSEGDLCGPDGCAL